VVESIYRRTAHGFSGPHSAKKSAPSPANLAVVPYRIHFTSQDLARTRVTDTPMPLIELGIAARAFQDRTHPARFDGWRQRVRALPKGARMVLSLHPTVGFSPTFIMPSYTGTIEEVLDNVRATPRSAVHSEMAALAVKQAVPSWARRLPDDRDLFEEICTGVGSLYSLLLEPYWDPITDLFAADRSVRMRQLLTGGIEKVLSQANPQWLRWVPPVLELHMPNGIDHDLYLEGQGVVLVPSLFRAHSLVDDETYPQPMVSYPAGVTHPIHRLSVLAARQGSSAVAALLGSTRAAVLCVVAEHPGCSTKELAARAGVSPPSASEHATVLRRAGLIQTRRHRNVALHSATNLGIALLNARETPL
jgi:DNA-binding transcriptional ArsR family regulator